MAELNYPAAVSDERSPLIESAEERTCLKPWTQKVWVAPELPRAASPHGWSNYKLANVPWRVESACRTK